MAHRAPFLRLGSGRGAVAEVIQVQVNAQLPVYQAVIVEIGTHLVRRDRPHLVAGDSGEPVRKHPVPIDIVVHIGTRVQLQVASPLQLAADGMEIGDLPVHADIAVEALLKCVGRQPAHVADGGGGERNPFGIAVLVRALVRIVQPGEDIHAAGTVVDAQRADGIVVTRRLKGLGIGGVEVEAEAVALAADGADADHAAHGGIVLRAGVGDHLDALDLIALQAVQFTGISHFMAIDIHEGASFADDLQSVLPLDDAGGLGKHVVGRAGILQHRAAYARLQAFAREFGLGHHGRGHGAFQQGRVVFQRDDGAVNRREILRTVTQDGDHQDAIGVGRDQMKAAVFFRDGTADDGGIGFREECDIGVLQGLALAVDDFSSPVLFRKCERCDEQQEGGEKVFFHN